MNAKTIISILAALFIVPKLFAQRRQEELIDQTESEEPATVIEFGTSEYIPSFCVLNPASFAGTLNFGIHEFHSKDGISVPDVIKGNVQEIMNILEIIRAYVNSNSSIELKIIVNSGWRSPMHNTTVGGSDTSFHLCGKAVDFKIPGYTGSELYDLILFLIDQGIIPDGGLGKYTNFVHYDTGPARRW